MKKARSRTGNARRRAHLGAALALSVLPWLVWAHGVNVGDLEIDHPYATPSLPGANGGTVYFRSIRNEGKTADRLLSASSPVAERIEIQRVQADGQAPRAETVPSLDLPAGQAVTLRHDAPEGYRLLLSSLKAPLKDGDRFTVSLRFERAGPVDVKVWVQTPKSAAQGHAH